jgi:PIN domain nuclease of toxin-antitoxin system
MRGLLLDTHVLLWWLKDDPRLGPKTKALIRDPETVVWVSAASAWEIAIKVALGRLDLDAAPQFWLVREIEQNGIRTLPITFKHALAVGVLPAHHADPFDRMLIAQAQEESLRLVTSDPSVRKYGPVLDARQ